MGRQPLPKRITLSISASDVLSSVAYTPDEILLALALVGSLAVMQSLWVGVFVALVLAVIVMSYRRMVRAYPSGDDDYKVVTKSLGRNWGLFVTFVLLVNYILTVTISISSGIVYITTALPAPHGHRLIIAVSLVILLALVNLQGTKDAGGAFVIPTYIYICSILLMILVGLIEFSAGTLRQAPTAQYRLTATPDHVKGLIGLGEVFLLMRAFSSGCAALTDVETISNGIPVFKRPKSKNVIATLAVLGTIAMTMILSILLLARAAGVKIAENPALQPILNGAVADAKTYIRPVVGQLAAAVFGNGPILFLLTMTVMGLVLVLTANTAFNGFPALVSVLSRGSFLPRQLYKRGDRLSYSNGILAFALAAVILIVAFEAGTAELIELYVVGMFISLTLSQFDVIRHWNRQLRMHQNGSERGRVLRSRAMNVISFMMVSLMLLIVLMTKFIHDA